MKQVIDGEFNGRIVFRTLRGAWIETCSSSRFTSHNFVRTLRGAWIETTNLSSSIDLDPFRTLRGAWIETVEPFIDELTAFNSHPQGCVD